MSQMELAASPLQSGELRPVRSFRLIRRLLRRPVAILAIAVIVLVYGAGLSAPIVAPYDFDKTISTTRSRRRARITFLERIGSAETYSQG